MEIIIAYLMIGIVVTLLVLITKYFKSKSFDELSNRDIIERFVGWTLLWPYIAFYSLPKHGNSQLFKKYEDNSFDFSEAMNNRQSELFSLWESPPVCSDNIEIKGYNESTYEILPSKLRFKSNAVVEHLNELNTKNEFSVFNQEAIIFKWVNQKSVGDNTVCTVPEELDRFKNIANSLLFKGQGKVFCEDCKQNIVQISLNVYLTNYLRVGTLTVLNVVTDT